MQILVAVKGVMNPAGLSVDRKSGRVSFGEEGWITNPADASALLAALRLRDQVGGAVIAAAWGGEQAGDRLRDALGMGADRAILVGGEGLPGIDEAGVVKVLAAMVRLLDPVRLVCLGAEALDSGRSQLGARLAQALGQPYLADCIRVEASDRKLRAVSLHLGAFVDLEAPLPAVAGFVAQEPDRYPNAARLFSAYQAEASLDRWSLVQLGLSPGDLQPVRAELGPSFPPEKDRWTLTGGDPDELATLLAAELKGR